MLQTKFQGKSKHISYFQYFFFDNRAL